jgi:hypothetical protein
MTNDPPIPCSICRRDVTDEPATYSVALPEGVDRDDIRGARGDTHGRDNRSPLFDVSCRQRFGRMTNRATALLDTLERWAALGRAERDLSRAFDRQAGRSLFLAGECAGNRLGRGLPISPRPTAKLMLVAGRDPMIDVHIRVSRRFVFWLAVLLLAGVVVPYVLSSRGAKQQISQVTTFQTP